MAGRRSPLLSLAATNALLLKRHRAIRGLSDVPLVQRRGPHEEGRGGKPRAGPRDALHLPIRGGLQRQFNPVSRSLLVSLSLVYHALDDYGRNLTRNPSNRSSTPTPITRPRPTPSRIAPRRGSSASLPFRALCPRFILEPYALTCQFASNRRSSVRGVLRRLSMRPGG